MRNKPLQYKAPRKFLYSIIYASTAQMWFQLRRFFIYIIRNEFSAAGFALADILVIEKPDDRRCIQILQPGQILFAAKKIPAQSDLTILVP